MEPLSNHDEVALAQTRHLLVCAIQTLPPSLRKVFVMHRIRGFSIPQVADVLHVPHRTVVRRLSRGLVILHRQLSALDPEAGLASRPLYDIVKEIPVPLSRIITDVTPKLQIATATLAEQLKPCPEGVHQLTPRQFEQLIGDLLTDMAHGRVQITPYSRDGGRDLLAYVDLDIGRLLCLIEAKKYRQDRAVGIELVRTLYGVVCDEDASHGTLITTSFFTEGAREFQSAHEHRLSLRDYDHVAAWIRRYRTRRH